MSLRRQISPTFFGASGVVYLPGSPKQGDVVIVKAGSDLSSSIVISVTGSGSGGTATNHKMDGSLDAVALKSPYAAISFVYNSGSTGVDWRII